MHAALVTLQVSTTRTKLICHPITWRITSCVRALPSLNLTSEKERLLEVYPYLKMLEEQIHRYFFRFNRSIRKRTVSSELFS